MASRRAFPMSSEARAPTDSTSPMCHLVSLVARVVAPSAGRKRHGASAFNGCTLRLDCFLPPSDALFLMLWLRSGRIKCDDRGGALGHALRGTCIHRGAHEGCESQNQAKTYCFSLDCSRDERGHIRWRSRTHGDLIARLYSHVCRAKHIAACTFIWLCSHGSREKHIAACTSI